MNPAGRARRRSTLLADMRLFRATTASQINRRRRSGRLLGLASPPRANIHYAGRAIRVND